MGCFQRDLRAEWRLMFGSRRPTSPVDQWISIWNRRPMQLVGHCDLDECPWDRKVFAGHAGAGRASRYKATCCCGNFSSSSDLP